MNERASCLSDVIAEALLSGGAMAESIKPNATAKFNAICDTGFELPIPIYPVTSPTAAELQVGRGQQ